MPTLLAKNRPEHGTRKGWWSHLSFGPGVVFLLAVTGPRDLVSNSAAGAGYGYATLWILLVVVVARFVMLEASARYVLATGESLLRGYARVGRWVNWVILVSLLVKRHLGNLYQILLLGTFSHMLVPLPTRWSSTIWALIFWSLGFVLMYWGRYRMVERCSRPLLLLLGGTLIAIAVLSRPDPAAIARGLFIPSFPADQGAYSYMFVVMALAGASAGSLSNLKYAAFVHEKGWRDMSALTRQRCDLLLSVLGILGTSVLIQVAAAASLRPMGVPLKEVEDLLPLFTPALGETGRIVLVVGVWAAVFNTYVTTNTGYSLMATDIYHAFLRPPGDLKDAGGSIPSYSSRPAYRWVLIFFCVSPLYVLLTDWQPIWITLLSASINVVLLPVVVGVLLRLTSDRRRMGPYANGWLTNVVMVLVVVTAAFLTCQNAIDYWKNDLSPLFR